MQVKVAVLDDYQGVALEMADWSGLREAAEVEVFCDHLSGEAQLVERLAPFEVICAMRERTPFQRSLLEQLPRLKLLLTTGMRNASIDLMAARECGVTVCGTRGKQGSAAELTWALILAAARRLPEELGSVRAGGWQTCVGSDLSGSTLGVVGLGNLGRTVARYGRAFEMNVIAWSPNLTSEKASDAGAELVSKEELFRRADWVTVHLVLSERTRDLIGAAELGWMKRTAWLVNTSRGPLVNESALLAVLESRTIAGAALDVYDVEPLAAEHPFRTLANVIPSPHIGYVTEATYRLFFNDTIENIQGWLGGRPVRVLQ